MRILILVGLALATGIVFAQDPPATNTPPAEPPAEATPADDVAADTTAIAGDAAGNDRVSIDEIRRFVSVFRAVKQAYVEPIDDAQLMQAAIRGLLTDLDPHSAYLDASQSRGLNEMASGAYDGLGLEVIQNPDRSLMVVAPIDDTPAARAGIRPGDVISEIDGKAITADNVDAAVESMRGAPGTEIQLTIQRQEAAEPLRVTLKRETIRVASARVRMLEPGFALLRLAMFQGDTAQEAERKLKELAKGEPLRGLVLDLRSNPGGLLSAAVEAADLFLDEGQIVSTGGRMPYAKSEFRAQRGDILNGAPIVVLTDAGTASAAEVLTGALRDHRRALVMGSTTFGKGSVQSVLPLDNGDSVKLTTSLYYTPNGTSIQATGIQPDIVLPDGAELHSADRPPTLRERDLPGHLRSSSDAAVVVPVPAAKPEEGETDFAVREALNLLKGLALFTR